MATTTRLRTLLLGAAVATVAIAGCSEDMLSTEADNGGPSEYSADQWEDYSCSLFARNDIGTQHKDVEGLVEHLELDVPDDDVSGLEADLLLHCQENPGDGLVDAMEQITADG